MEITAIIVFTAIALWFVTEVGGENLLCCRHGHAPAGHGMRLA